VPRAAPRAPGEALLPLLPLLLLLLLPLLLLLVEEFPLSLSLLSVLLLRLWSLPTDEERQGELVLL
jgi:hypothetical protein